MIGKIQFSNPYVQRNAHKKNVSFTGIQEDIAKTITGSLKKQHIIVPHFKLYITPEEDDVTLILKGYQGLPGRPYNDPANEIRDGKGNIIYGTGKTIEEAIKNMFDSNRGGNVTNNYGKNIIAKFPATLDI